MVLQSLFRRIIDFGSALDEFTMKHYYGSVGPSRYFFLYIYFGNSSFSGLWILIMIILWIILNSEQNKLMIMHRPKPFWTAAGTVGRPVWQWSMGVLLFLFFFKRGSNWPWPSIWHLFSCRYDMWSVGVVMLEMILGSPNVFDISSVTRALLDQHIRGWSENFKELAYK